MTIRRNSFMKKLLLTVAIASMALPSVDAFASRVGNGGKGRESRPTTETREQREVRERKAQQAGKAGNSTITVQAQNAASNLLNKTNVVTGLDFKKASDNIAKAIQDGLLRRDEVESLANNANRDIAINMTNFLAVASLKNLLVKGEQGEGIVKFLRIEAFPILNGKSTYTADALSRVNTTVVEATRALQNGQVRNLSDALIAGLKKAGITDMARIREILKECFKIVV